MFICNNCGQTGKGIKQQKVVTEIRKVKYIYRIKIEKIGMVNEMPSVIDTYYKTVNTSMGFEIANEQIYCVNCVSKIEPRITGEEVTRTIDIKTVQERPGRSRERERY